MASNNPPTLPPVESSDSPFNPSFDSPAANGGTHNDGAHSVSPLESQPPQPYEKEPQQLPDAPHVQTDEQVQKVLYSDIGVTTLLNRLKASIASARVSYILISAGSC